MKNKRMEKLKIMVEKHEDQSIIEELEKVEHPAIATSLLNLGMLKDIEVNSEGKVSLTLVLPFENIPDNIRDYIVNSLAAATQKVGGELVQVRLGQMNDLERQTFLTIEQQNWRG